MSEGDVSRREAEIILEAKPTEKHRIISCNGKTILAMLGGSDETCHKRAELVLPSGVLVKGRQKTVVLCGECAVRLAEHLKDVAILKRKARDAAARACYRSAVDDGRKKRKHKAGRCVVGRKGNKTIWEEPTINGINGQ